MFQASMLAFSGLSVLDDRRNKAISLEVMHYSDFTTVKDKTGICDFLN